MTSVSEPSLGGRRVLVADETARERWAYVGLLREAGARVTEARDGPEALELARAEQPDLIIAGPGLPGMDGPALSAALLREPVLARIPVVLVRDRGAPEPVRPPDGEAGTVVAAFLAALGAHRDPGSDPVERENVRAQSMVAMHRDPANHVSQSADIAWRLRTSAMPHADGSVSGFSAELQVVSKVFGAGLIALILATVGVILWRLASSVAPTEVAEPVVPIVEVELAPPPAPASDAAAARPVEPRGLLAAFSGELRPGVDADIGATSQQGALVLEGDAEIHVTVAGVDRGALPISMVLDEGRYVVRYRAPDGFTDRFYYVKAGATRTLHAITRPGGFVDAR